MHPLTGLPRPFFESLKRAVMHYHTMVHLVTAFLSPQPHGPSSIPPANLLCLQWEMEGGGSLLTWPFFHIHLQISCEKPLQPTRRSEERYSTTATLSCWCTTVTLQRPELTERYSIIFGPAQPDLPPSFACGPRLSVRVLGKTLCHTLDKQGLKYPKTVRCAKGWESRCKTNGTLLLLLLLLLFGDDAATPFRRTLSVGEVE
ncbi:hypothetical protein LY78DRAFT_146557 [Colletotrichum sublineola]|nr:hypothetical protein LY78DRAFT_146557 [Colletotrichum sublineola]